MEKQYQELIKNRIYFGAASDIQYMADHEDIEVVVDLRDEAVCCAASHPNLNWCHTPIGDDATHPQTTSFQQAIHAVVSAYQNGQKVAFHCGGGKGRTGAVAVGVLLELGLYQTLDEAEAAAKAIRPVINIKPNQRETLLLLYSNQK